MKHVGAKIFVNSITMIRVVGTFLMPFISYKMTPGEIIIYIILLLLTDTFDGLMARKFNVCTIFGAILDATADKLLGIATLAVLTREYPIMFIPILTETLITLINTNGATRGASMESSFLGKFKTWLMGICIVLGFITIYALDIIELIKPIVQDENFFLNLLNSTMAHEKLIMNSLAGICAGAGLMVAADYKSRVKNDVKKAKENGLVAKEFKLKKGPDLVFALFDENYYLETKNQPLLQRLGEKELKHERKSKRK